MYMWVGSAVADSAESHQHALKTSQCSHRGLVSPSAIDAVRKGFSSLTTVVCHMHSCPSALECAGRDRATLSQCTTNLC